MSETENNKVHHEDEKKNEKKNDEALVQRVSSP